MTGSNVINVLKGALAGGGGGEEMGGCAWSQSFLLATDNRRSRLDSPFCVITQHRKFVFGHHRQSKKDKQCSGTDNEAITDFNFCYSTNQFQTAQLQITQKKILPQRSPPFFNFCIA